MSLPSISKSEIPAYFTTFRRGLLVSCILASGMIGALIASAFADLVGRRTAQLLNNAFFIGGSLAMALAPSFWWLVYARAAVGLGVGVSSALTNLYISEISPAAHRGELGGWAPFLSRQVSSLVAPLARASMRRHIAWRLILVSVRRCLRHAVCRSQTVPSREYVGCWLRAACERFVVYTALRKDKVTTPDIWMTFYSK